MVNAVDLTIVTVVDTEPLPTNAIADLPDAVLSETTRAVPFRATVIFSASTTGVVELDVAAATGAVTVVPGATTAGAADRNGVTASRVPPAGVAALPVTA